MPENIENMTDPPETEDDFRPAGMAEGVAEPKPVGIKFVLASILLLVFVGYLVYVGFSDPRGPPAASENFKS